MSEPEPRPRDLRERPWQARYGLQMFYVLLGLQFTKALAVLVWTAYKGLSVEQSIEMLKMMSGTVEWVLLAMLAGAMWPWMFGPK